MKTTFLISLLFLRLSAGWSQNALPAITSGSLTWNEQLHTIEISFDLSDADNSQLEVRCIVYHWDDARLHEDILPLSISGDAGFPINPGQNKKIQLQLDPNTAYSKLKVILIAGDREPLVPDHLLSQVDTAQLNLHVTQLEGKRNTTDPTHYLKSRNYLREQLLSKSGYRELEFRNAQYYCLNFESTQSGYETPEETYVIDAHYDSAPTSPGADDNASGVAGVLEATRILQPYASKKSLRYLLFDLEENGLVGSTIYMSNQASKKDLFKGTINLEMIGYYSEAPYSQSFPTGFNILFPDAFNELTRDSSRGNFITNVGNTNSKSLIQRFQDHAAMNVPELKVISLEVPGNGSLVPDLRRSDHAVFWDRGIPALMLTDGANFRNKNYHTPRDSSTYLNFGIMAQVVKASLSTLIDLACVEHSTSKEFDLQISTSTSQEQQDQLSLHYEQGQLIIHSKLDLKDQVIRLTDMNGRLILQQQIGLFAHAPTAIECKLPAGLYGLFLSGKTNESTP
ncbi:MAG TPA: M28 family peptidase, partial [Saprospiraceae bacterium]|nr:M28 family peptidase [Saprospiraceae bacterium]